MAEYEDEIFGSAETAAREPDNLPEGQSYPLSLKRLTSSHICQLATELCLPANASTDEMRQMIEGTLIAQGRELGNVQLIVQEKKKTVREVHLFLVDNPGVFHQTKTVATLKEKTFLDLLKHIAQLEKMVTDMTEQLNREKEKATKLWWQSCRKLEAVDATLVER